MPRRSAAALRACLVALCVLTRLAFVATPADAAYGGLRLPWPPGRAYLVPQTPGAFQSGAQGGGSPCLGNDVWAYDFGLHIGDRVSAAHSGTVIRYVAGFGIGSCDPAFRNDANYIVLDHGDGYSSIYWHISYASPPVAPRRPGPDDRARSSHRRRRRGRHRVRQSRRPSPLRGRADTAGRRVGP